jgi:hypothetical protein
MAETMFWCRSCRIGFALLKSAPEACPHCHAGDNWWTPESPTPRVAYNLTVNDMRLLRGLRINPE